jgi:hypothetical protein
MRAKDSHDVNIESNGDGPLDISKYVLIITYMQIGEVLIRLTSKECDGVMHRAKRFLWEGDSHLHVE